jgi:dolichol-phosphate mannosyltransferase
VAGKSKYGVRRTIKVLLDLVTVMFLKRYHTKPIYVFGGLAFLMASIGSLLCAVVLWQKFGQGAWVHRNPLFIIAAICFVASIQLLVTGVVAEMLTRTYFESQKKTAYTIESLHGFASETPARATTQEGSPLPPPAASGGSPLRA